MSESQKPHSPTLQETQAGLTGSSETLRDLTGATLGDFQVERMLGRGGMGEVYLARQISLNRPVALKVLRSDLLSKPTYLSRFEAEATMVAKLNHPNIVHVYMLGNIDDIRFIAMEYVQGTNLRDYLQKKGALDLPLALSIMKQSAVAIGAAGEVGLIHRDIKPENLLLTRKGQVKVADFGLCRDQDAEHLHLTQPGVTMGTPIYMSPEQAQGHALDHRSDLYSLGVTYYHMLAGAPPFRAETALAVALKHVRDTPVRLIVHRPDLPVELDHLVMKLMAKSPDQRYQSAAEMLRDLGKVRESLASQSQTPSEPEITVTGNGIMPLVSPTVVASSAPTPAPLASSTLNAPTAGPRFGKTQGIILATLALAAGLGWGWYKRPPNLLAENAPTTSTMPGLWMAPDWMSIDKQKTSADQYHFAQLRDPRTDAMAAWLAVPGYFHDDRDYCSKAYIQLTRYLFVQGDVERLRALSEEISTWKEGKTLGKELHLLVKAAVSTLDDDLDDVSVQIEDPTHGIKIFNDVGLFELAMTITDEALVAAKKEGSQAKVRIFMRLKNVIRENFKRNADLREALGH